MSVLRRHTLSTLEKLVRRAGRAFKELDASLFL